MESGKGVVTHPIAGVGMGWESGQGYRVSLGSALIRVIERWVPAGHSHP
ncbi:hypothetical protein [Thermocoleostomius sinensis]|uniref:Uncharacterized protein n=1 Tax=Thermocoleostomius sinensis A174 TaxID=2016057 RepID=A0A9E9C4Z8_9CYAN|nr:hypothetical protein [Thermocoleostomius sinensis]WAL60586.1 hypothetical protein OXH18_00905 [Thermocoleostomius sinensis A174]